MKLAALLGIILVVALASVILKQYKPEYSLVLTLVGSAVALIVVFTAVSPLLDQLKALAERTGVQVEWVKLLIKALGICYLTQFAADSCRDAGQTSLAAKAEMAGRVTVLVMSVPMLGQVMELVLKLVA